MQGRWDMEFSDSYLGSPALTALTTAKETAVHFGVRRLAAAVLGRNPNRRDKRGQAPTLIGGLRVKVLARAPCIAIPQFWSFPDGKFRLTRRDDMSPFTEKTRIPGRSGDRAQDPGEPRQ